MFYLGARTLAGDDRTKATTHAVAVLDFEEVLKLDIEREIQQTVVDHPPFITFLTNFYVWAYWPTIIASLIVLRYWRPHHFYRLRTALFVSGVLGLIVIVAYPVAPPRMLTGFVDTVGDDARGHFTSRPSGLVNHYAAMPSFHVGWFALCLTTVAAAFRKGSLYLLAATATATMTLAVIVTGNHFTVDVIAGLSLSALGYYVATRRHG